MASATTITMNSSQSSNTNHNNNTNTGATTTSSNSSSSNKNMYTYNSNVGGSGSSSGSGYLQQRHNNIVNCLKFVPQAFNTNKCQQCFNIKDVHSVEALSEFTKVKLFLSYS